MFARSAPKSKVHTTYPTLPNAGFTPSFPKAKKMNCLYNKDSIVAMFSHEFRENEPDPMAHLEVVHMLHKQSLLLHAGDISHALADLVSGFVDYGFNSH